MRHKINYMLLTAFLVFFPHIVYAGHIIAGAEYYIDNDPGEGKGTPIAAEDGSYDSDFESIETEIDLPTLTVGQHFLYVRMKNEKGIWGISRKYPFMVTGTKTIDAAEYYIDVDPGEGKGIPLVLKDGELDGQFKEINPLEIDTSFLSVGMHRLFIRMYNSEGYWGPSRQYAFEVSKPSFVKKAECFIDTDPGEGKGIGLNASDGAFDAMEEYFEGEIDIADLGTGLYTHTVYIRAQDSYQRWGKPEKRSFEVTDLPIGDCNGDSQVSIDEVQKCINCFLGIQDDCCDKSDLNSDGQVTIDEVQKVINAFLGR